MSVIFLSTPSSRKPSLACLCFLSPLYTQCTKILLPLSNAELSLSRTKTKSRPRVWVFTEGRLVQDNERTPSDKRPLLAVKSMALACRGTACSPEPDHQGPHGPQAMLRPTPLFPATSWQVRVSTPTFLQEASPDLSICSAASGPVGSPS